MIPQEGGKVKYICNYPAAPGEIVISPVESELKRTGAKHSWPMGQAIKLNRVTKISMNEVHTAFGF